MAKDNGFSETPAKDEGAKSRRPSRRAFLKAGGALLGGAAGAGAITGFPTIWAQEIKDIELRHVGVSYSVVKAIGDQASKDLGFKVTMQNLDTSAAINRFITQPNSVDIADVEGWQSKLATKRGVLQGIEVKKIKEFDNILPIFTKGELEGHKIPRQGISPYEAHVYREAECHRTARRRDRLDDLPAAGLQRRLDRLPAGPGRPSTSPNGRI